MQHTIPFREYNNPVMLRLGLLIQAYIPFVTCRFVMKNRFRGGLPAIIINEMAYVHKRYVDASIIYFGNGILRVEYCIRSVAKDAGVE